MQPSNMYETPSNPSTVLFNINFQKIIFLTVWCIPGIVCITYSINATLSTAQSYCLFISFCRFFNVFIIYYHCYSIAALLELFFLLAFLNLLVLSLPSHMSSLLPLHCSSSFYYPAIVWRRLLLFMRFLLIVHKGKLGQTENSLLFENEIFLFSSPGL